MLCSAGLTESIGPIEQGWFRVGDLSRVILCELRKALVSTVRSSEVSTITTAALAISTIPERVLELLDLLLT